MARAPRSRAGRARPEGRFETPLAGAADAEPPRSRAAIVLAAIVLGVPTAVLDGSAGPYDDPKAWALPILAAIAVAAWLSDARGGPLLPPAGPGRAGRWLRALVLASLAWAVVATVLSVAPGLSVFGNFGRGMGLFATGALLALFFVAQGACRDARAVRGLVDTALLGSVPVCLLGLGQALGWDPFPRAWDPATAGLSVRSTLGQHIFLGGYLAVLIPLAGARLESSWRRRPSDADRGAPRRVLAGAAWAMGVVAIVALAARWPVWWWALVPWGVLGALARARATDDRELARPVAVGLFGALLALQVAVLMLSRARGPLLGVLLGAAVASFVLLARRRARKTIRAAVAIVVALVLGLVLLNVPGSPLAPLARLPLLSRLAALGDVAHGSPVWFRIHLWEGIGRGWTSQLRGEAVIPLTTPWLRSVVGYGPETELIALDPMAQRALAHPGTAQGGFTAYYLVDRAHNTLLEHLMRYGIVGAALWLGVIVTLLVAAFSRLRDASDAEASLRLGGIGAIVAHLAEGQVGITTAAPLALFWITAAWIAQPIAREASERAPVAARIPTWRAAAIAGAVVWAGVAAWGMSQWLLASRAYAQGALLGMAGKRAEALPSFERALHLMPWLPLPAEAIAQTRLQLGTTEPDPARRGASLREGESVILGLRRYAVPGPADWALAANLAFAQMRDGDRAKLAPSLEAYARAVEMAPRNPELLTQWGFALLHAGDGAGARRAAERALAQPGGNTYWFAWAVLARACLNLGLGVEAQQAAYMARTLAPAAVRPALDALIR